MYVVNVMIEVFNVGVIDGRMVFGLKDVDWVDKVCGLVEKEVRVIEKLVELLDRVGWEVVWVGRLGGMIRIEEVRYVWRVIVVWVMYCGDRMMF